MDLHDDLRRLRDQQPAHPDCAPCRRGDCENCAHLIRPTSCGCLCGWLSDGRAPRPSEGL